MPGEAPVRTETGGRSRPPPTPPPPTKELFTVWLIAFVTCYQSDAVVSVSSQVTPRRGAAGLQERLNAAVNSQQAPPWEPPLARTSIRNLWRTKTLTVQRWFQERPPQFLLQTPEPPGGSRSLQEAPPRRARSRLANAPGPPSAHLCGGPFHTHLQDAFVPLVVRYIDLMESSIGQSVHRGFQQETWQPVK